MKGKILFILLILVLFSSLTYAEDLKCQYKYEETNSTMQSKLFNADTKEFMSEGLEFVSFSSGTASLSADMTTVDGACVASFVVYNPTKTEYNAVFDFEVLKSRGETEAFKKKAMVPAMSTVSIKESIQSTKCEINNKTISYYILEPVFMVPEITQVSKTKQVCRMCGDKICLNDGERCSKNKECGSGLCESYVCAKLYPCVDGNCNCKKDEVSCTNRCVKKGKLDIGEAPICRAEECKSGYMDPMTLKCADMDKEKAPPIAKSEDKTVIKEDSESHWVKYWWIIFVIGIFAYILMRKKNKYKNMTPGQLEQESNQLQHDLANEKFAITEIEDKIKWLKKMQWFNETEKINSYTNLLNQKIKSVKVMEKDLKDVRKFLKK